MLAGVGGLIAIVLFVTAHEAGHFVAAKATGMKATEFFFGFGPRLWSFRRGETEYGIKAFPLGGYVKIVGMSALEQVDPADEARTYRVAPFWKKSVVVLAGVAANFVIAYLIFFALALSQGVAVPSPEVGQVVEELPGGEPAPAAEAGLVEGDRIVAVDGVATPGWEELQAALESRPGETVTLLVERGDERIELLATLAAVENPETGEPQGKLGFVPAFDRERGVGTAAVGAADAIRFTVGLTFEVFGNIIRPESLGRLAGGLVGEEVPDEIRPVSLIGIFTLGAQADEIGIGNYIGLLASVNVILGTLNALPLYPLDGGHFAVAVYEKVTGRRADIRKLAPVAAMVIAFVAFLGLVGLVLDIFDPIDL